MTCQWKHVKDALPRIGQNILVKGYLEMDFETYYEEGFRSELDKKKYLKEGRWHDFSFNVTHWILIAKENK